MVRTVSRAQAQRTSSASVWRSVATVSTIGRPWAVVPA
jgi:hypothetical protein